MAMSYVVNAQGTDSALCHELLAKHSDKLARMSGVPAELVLKVESAYIGFGTQAEKFKPSLFLVGRPTVLRGNFPCGIIEMDYTTPQDRSLMVYRYELNRRDLTEMVRKGFYEPGFEVPPIIQNNEFELPVRTTCVCMPPQQVNGPQGAYMEPPLGFVSIEADSCVCTDETSGYSICDYFPFVEAEPAYDKETELATEKALAGEEFDKDVRSIVEEMQEGMDLSGVTGEQAEQVQQPEHKAGVSDSQPHPSGARTVSDMPEVSSSEDEDEPDYI